MVSKKFIFSRKLVLLWKLFKSFYWFDDFSDFILRFQCLSITNKILFWFSILQKIYWKIFYLHTDFHLWFLVTNFNIEFCCEIVWHLFQYRVQYGILRSQQKPLLPFMRFKRRIQFIQNLSLKTFAINLSLWHQIVFIGLNQTIQL